MNALLEKAVKADNAAYLKELVEDQKIDWKESNQKALYLAMKEGSRDCTLYMMSELLHKHSVELCRAKIRAAGDFTPDDEIDKYIGDMVTGHDTQGMRAIEQALASPDNIHILGEALKIDARGVFDYLAEADPELIRDKAIFVANIYHAHTYARQIVEMGGQAEYVAGNTLNEIIASGDIDTVRFMLEKGVKPDWPFDTPTNFCFHPLYFAANLRDEALRKEMSSLLLEYGADIRTGKLHAIGVMAGERRPLVFDFVEKVDPGSELPLLMGMQSAVKYWRETPPFLNERYPHAQKWFAGNYVHPMFDTNLDKDGSWMKRIGALPDINEDDGFLLKMAVISPQAEVMTALILGQPGAVAHTRKDQPLKLAVMLEKPQLFEALVTRGADVYADNGAAFTEAMRIDNPHICAELAKAAKQQEVQDGRSFRNCYDTGLTRSILREERSGETGLALCAKAGLFGELVANGVICNLSAEDFLKVGATGSNLLHVLASRGEYKMIFNKSVWGDDAEGPLKVWEALGPHHRGMSDIIFGEFRQEFTTQKALAQLKPAARKYKM